jgi:photosystem II stability/assembly factor-like uncharacterized protein
VQDSGLASDLRAIKFGTPNLGLVGGDGGALALTNDGGVHWLPVTTGTQASVRSVAVSSTGVLLAVGDGGFAMRSMDGGASWSAMTIPGGGDLLAVTMDPAAQTAIIGDSLGRIFWTIDQGHSFYLETTASQPIRALSIANDGVRALAVGDGGTVLERRSEDQWVTVAANTSANLHAALILDGDAAEYIAGDGGTLLQSLDAGNHWAAVPVSMSANIYGLDDL